MVSTRSTSLAAVTSTIKKMLCRCKHAHVFLKFNAISWCKYHFKCVYISSLLSYLFLTWKYLHSSHVGGTKTKLRISLSFVENLKLTPTTWLPLYCHLLILKELVASQEYRKALYGLYIRSSFCCNLQWNR